MIRGFWRGMGIDVTGGGRGCEKMMGVTKTYGEEIKLLESDGDRRSREGEGCEC